MALQPGDLLHERYRVIETLAQGGMGAIYRASDLSLNIEVALKENFREADQFARQFHREAALLASLNQANLPRVTDYFTTSQGGQYLVMDFIPGEDLRQTLLHQPRIDVAEVVRIGAAVCEALEYLHSRKPPIIHRDVKPGNVKVTPRGEVFLVDFGLAKQAQSGEATTVGAQALTPGYAPPEQYGQGTEPRSDIYALGATLYAALTGKIPEDGLARAMGSADLTPIRQHNPEVTPRTAKAIERAMAVRPDERYGSAAEFRAALLGLPEPGPDTTSAQSIQPSSREGGNIASHSDQSSPTLIAARPPSHQSPGRKAWWPWLAGSLAALLALGLGAALVSRLTPGVAPLPTSTLFIEPRPSATHMPSPSATSTASPTLPPTTTVTLTPQVVAIENNSTATPPLEPSATPRGGSARIAFSSQRDGSTQIWTVSSDGKDLQQVTHLPDGACQPDWSPDGQSLVFISPCAGRKDIYPGASLFTIHADGTGLVALASLPGGDFDPAWSPDGKQIAFTSLRSGKLNIYLYDLAANQVTRLSKPVNYERHPAWSPDGTTIAYETTRTGNPEIWVMAADGSKMREFSPNDQGNCRMPAWAPDGSYIVYSQGNDLPTLETREFPGPNGTTFRLDPTLLGAEDARISPDGRQLVFTRYDRSGASYIFLENRSGTGLVRLTDSEADEFHAAWQP